MSVSKARILMLLLAKIPQKTGFDVKRLVSCLHECLSSEVPLPFGTFSSILCLSTHLYTADRITPIELSELVVPLVQHAWNFLSSCEPKYHVETVRALWQLQTTMTPSRRDIEAAICALILERDTFGTLQRACRLGTKLRRAMVSQPAG